MRESFEKWFRETFPGMRLDGPSAKDEWKTYSEGYIAGMTRAVEKLIVTGSVGAIQQIETEEELLKFAHDNFDYGEN